MVEVVADVDGGLLGEDGGVEVAVDVEIGHSWSVGAWVGGG